MARRQSPPASCSNTPRLGARPRIRASRQPPAASPSRDAAALALFLVLCVSLGGCAAPFEVIDMDLARQARLALRQERPPQFDREEMEDGEFEREERPRRSVVVGELLAIFPGLLWHGLGHQYAGDHVTAKKIREAGGWGYLLTALGGGIALGGYFLDQEDDILDGYALSLYITGGTTAAIGSGFFFTAWFYDMIDTPRAVRTGGRPPPPGSLFGEGDEWD